VIVATSTNEHSLRSQVGIGSESDCLFEQLGRIYIWAVGQDLVDFGFREA